MSEYEELIERLTKKGFIKRPDSKLFFSKRIIDSEGDETSLRVKITLVKKFGECSSLLRHLDERVNWQ